MFSLLLLTYQLTRSLDTLREYLYLHYKDWADLKDNPDVLWTYDYSQTIWKIRIP
jgi:hypothetical protein